MNISSNLNRAITIILIIVILTAIAALIYIIITPKTGEKFTEFYLLGPNGKAEGYPRDLQVDEDATVIIGVVNHEYQTINYTIEVWLINQTTHKNQTTYHHMWYIDKTTTMLKHTPINIEDTWTPQWQHNYTFAINKKGNFKLAFLLFNTTTEEYTRDNDYKNIAEEKINNAYRETHLWINVT